MISLSTCKGTVVQEVLISHHSLLSTLQRESESHLLHLYSTIDLGIIHYTSSARLHKGKVDQYLSFTAKDLWSRFAVWRFQSVSILYLKKIEEIVPSVKVSIFVHLKAFRSPSVQLLASTIISSSPCLFYQLPAHHLDIKPLDPLHPSTERPDICVYVYTVYIIYIYIYLYIYIYVL